MNRDELVRLLHCTGRAASMPGSSELDPSGTGDRRALLRALSAAEGFEPDAPPLALVLVEPDGPLNDAALAALGSSLVRAAAGSVTARFADQAFAWLLPGNDRAGALRRAEDLREELSTTPQWVDGAALRLSLSLGVAVAPDDGRSPRSLLDSARLALASARAAGGNQVADAARALGPALAARAGLERLGRAPIFGRDAALRLIADGLRGLQEGHARVLLLGAEPGFGRTALLDTVRRQLERRAVCRTLFIEGSRAENARPYSLLGRIVRERLQLESDAGEALLHEIDEGEASAVQLMLSGPQPAAADPAANAAETPAGETTERPVPTAGQAMEDPGPAAREAWFQGALRLLERLLGDEPTALLLDDLELADDASLLVLKELVASGSCPLFLCAGAEEGIRTPLHDFLEGHGSELPIRRAALEGLAEEQIRGHLDVVFPGVDSATLAGQLARTTGGSPLFLRLLLSHLLAEGRIRLDGRVWRWEPEAGALPVSLAEVTRSLLGRLGAGDQRRLAVVASFGEPVALALLARLLGEPDPVVHGFVERARELGVLRTSEAMGVEWVQAISESVRGLATATQPAEPRRTLHENILRTLGAEATRLDAPVPASVLAWHEALAAGAEAAGLPRATDARVFDAAEAASWADVGSARWEGTPLDPDSAELVPSLPRALLMAVRAVRLYPQGSDTIGESLATLGRQLETVLDKNPALDMRLDADGEGLEINGEPLMLRDGRLMAPSLRDLLQKLELRGITLCRGVQADELEGVVRGLAETDPASIDSSTWARFAADEQLEHVVLHQVRYARMTGTGPDAALITGVPEPAKTGTRDLAGPREVLRSLLALARGIELYPLRSQAVVELLERLLQSLEPELSRHEDLTLSVAGDAVLLDGQPLESARFDPMMAAFVDLAAAKGLASVSFGRGLDRDELSRFVQALAECPEASDSVGHWERASIQYGLEHIAGNEQVYANRAATPVSLDRERHVAEASPAAAAASTPVAEASGPAPTRPASSPIAVDPRPQEPPSLDALLPELGERLAREVQAGEDESAGRLLAVAFGDFATLENVQREAVLEACRKAQRVLGLAYSRPLTRVLASPLFEALSLSDEPAVLGRCAELIQRLADDLLQLREHAMARRLCEGLRERREQLEARGSTEAARALGRRLDATSRRLVLGDLAAGGENAQDALRLLASQGVLAVPWMADAIASVEDRRLRTVLARQLAAHGRNGAEALSRALRDAKRPRERIRILEVLELAVTRRLSREVALALADHSEEVRAAALGLATRVRDPEVLDLLLRQTAHPQLLWALPAIDVLGDVRAYAATGCLLSLLESGEEPERVTAACRALGRIGSPEAFEPIATVLGRRGRFRRAHRWPTTTRAAAANALMQIDADRARELLGGFADDEDPIIAFLAQDEG